MKKILGIVLIVALAGLTSCGTESAEVTETSTDMPVVEVQETTEEVMEDDMSDTPSEEEVSEEVMEEETTEEK